MHRENVGLVECLSLRTQIQIIIIIGVIEIIKRAIEVITVINTCLLNIRFNNFLL